MRRRYFVIAGVVVAALFPAVHTSAAGFVPLSSWMPWAGDRFIVNVKTNSGYLVHFDGTYTTFPVATGQQRTVHYIGKTYFAATPEQTWTVESKDIKGDHVTFGPTGRFLRMYHEGERTSYGLHGHRDGAMMLSSNQRYRSMGCIIISEEVLDMLEKTFIEAGPFQVITAGVKNTFPEFVDPPKVANS